MNSNWLVLWFLLVAIGPLRAEVLVSSYITHRVLRFNETNRASLGVFVTNNNGLLSFPHGLAFGPDNNLYVASAGNDSVLRYHGNTGAFIDTFVPAGSGGLNYPVALIFRGGYLYVSSQLNSRVMRYNATNGAFVDYFVAPNSKVPEGFSDMVFGPDGNLYVTGRFTHQVLRYSGVTGGQIDVFVNANLSQPFGLRFGPDGHLYVASGNDDAVQRFNGTNGTFLGTFATNSTGELSLPVGIDFGPDGNLYVASFGRHNVARYHGATGAYLGNALGGPGVNNPNFMLFRPVPPTLRVSLADTNVLLSWPTNAIGFNLQQTTAIPSNWGSVTAPVTVTNGLHTVRLPLNSTNHFFRLRK